MSPGLSLGLGCLYADTNCSVSGIVNRYWAGLETIAGSRQFTVGTSGGSPEFLKEGDPILVVQNQGCRYENTNSAAFGDGSGSGTGYSNYYLAGYYGIFTVESVLYIDGNPNFTITTKETIPSITDLFLKREIMGIQQEIEFQVVQIAVCDNIFLDGNVFCKPWDGLTGGVIAMRAKNTFYFKQDDDPDPFSVTCNGGGFRGASVTFSNLTPITDVNELKYHSNFEKDGGTKGEGMCGGPGSLKRQDGTISTDPIPTYIDFYCRGGPGNGGGGGNGK
jgi:hypothetical protein